MSHSAFAQLPSAEGSFAPASRLLTATHRLSLGAAQQNVDAGVRATVEGGEPRTIKLNDLGIDDRDESYYLDYRYRINPRWTVVGGAYRFSGTGGARAERDFNFNGEEFTAGAEMVVGLDVDAYLLDAMYTLHRSERSEFMIGVGIHALDLGARVAARVSLGEEEAELRGSGTTLLAPVPNFRASGTWLITEHLALSAVGGWLSADIDDYDGRFIYGHLRAMYSFTGRFGVALGYQRTDVDITQTRSRSEIGYDVQLNGPTLTMTVAF